jgi:hypothetical protein
MPIKDGLEWKPGEGGKAYRVDPLILGYDTIALIEHALDQLKARGITLQDVETTLRNPDASIPTAMPDRERFRWNKTARVAIDVVFERHPSCLLVVTAIKIERRLVRRRP